MLFTIEQNQVMRFRKLQLVIQIAMVISSKLLSKRLIAL